MFIRKSKLESSCKKLACSFCIWENCLEVLRTPGRADSALFTCGNRSVPRSLFLWFYRIFKIIGSVQLYSFVSLKQWYSSDVVLCLIHPLENTFTRHTCTTKINGLGVVQIFFFYHYWKYFLVVSKVLNVFKRDKYQHDHHQCRKSCNSCYLGNLFFYNCFINIFHFSSKCT